MKPDCRYFRPIEKDTGACTKEFYVPAAWIEMVSYNMGWLLTNRKKCQGCLFYEDFQVEENIKVSFQEKYNLGTPRERIELDSEDAELLKSMHEQNKAILSASEATMMSDTKKYGGVK